MVRGDIHSPHLRALLDFESQRMGLPLSYHEAVLADDYQPPAFRREALIIAHTGFAPDPFGLPVEGGEVLVCRPRPHPQASGQRRRGPRSRWAHASRCRHPQRPARVLLAGGPVRAERCREASAGGLRRGTYWRPVFEMIMVRAVPILVANVRDYDWKAEQEQFAATRVRQVQARVARLEEDARNNDYAIESKTQEIAQLAHKNRELREHARLLESVTTREMKERAALELLALMKMAPRGCSAMDVQDEAIVVETHPVWVEHDDHDFDLGTFRVAIRLADDQVVIPQGHREQSVRLPPPARLIHRRALLRQHRRTARETARRGAIRGGRVGPAPVPAELQRRGRLHPHRALGQRVAGGALGAVLRQRLVRRLHRLRGQRLPLLRRPPRPLLVPPPG